MPSDMLKRAQASGDLEALLARGKRAVCILLIGEDLKGLIK